MDLREARLIRGGRRSGVVELWDARAFSTDGKLLPILRAFNHWITEGDTNILRLHPDYRETCSTTQNGSLVIGHSSGTISFIFLFLLIILIILFLMNSPPSLLQLVHTLHCLPNQTTSGLIESRVFNHLSELLLPTLP